MNQFKKKKKEYEDWEIPEDEEEDDYEENN